MTLRLVMRLEMTSGLAGGRPELRFDEEGPWRERRRE
jgi:hypothetical protein